MKCRYGIFSKRMTEIILENRAQEQYLPLAVARSKIPGAGKGVFATVDIPANTIVCSYIGDICTNESATLNDSLFTLGWVGSRCLMICPNRRSNVARYLNTG